MRKPLGQSVRRWPVFTAAWPGLGFNGIVRRLIPLVPVWERLQNNVGPSAIEGSREWLVWMNLGAMKMNPMDRWGRWFGRLGLMLGVTLLLGGLISVGRPPRYVAVSGVMVFKFTNIAQIRLRAQEFKSKHPAILQADVGQIISFRSGSDDSTRSMTEGFSFSLLAISGSPTEAEQCAARAAEEFRSALRDLIPEEKVHITAGRAPHPYSPMRDVVLPFVAPVVNRWLPSGWPCNAWFKFAERFGYWSLL